MAWRWYKADSLMVSQNIKTARLISKDTINKALRKSRRVCSSAWNCNCSWSSGVAATTLGARRPAVTVAVPRLLPVRRPVAWVVLLVLAARALAVLAGLPSVSTDLAVRPDRAALVACVAFALGALVRRVDLALVLVLELGSPPDRAEAAEPVVADGSGLTVLMSSS